MSCSFSREFILLFDILFQKSTKKDKTLTDTFLTESKWLLYVKVESFSLFSLCADFLSQTVLGWKVTVAACLG